MRWDIRWDSRGHSGRSARRGTRWCEDAQFTGRTGFKNTDSGNRVLDFILTESPDDGGSTTVDSLNVEPVVGYTEYGSGLRCGKIGSLATGSNKKKEKERNKHFTMHCALLC